MKIFSEEFRKFAKNEFPQLLGLALLIIGVAFNIIIILIAIMSYNDLLLAIGWLGVPFTLKYIKDKIQQKS